jgi:predicted dehydrogenase
VTVIRLGLVGVNTSHADAFSRIFNGSETEEPGLTGGRIVALWHDPGQADRAVELASRHQIEAIEPDLRKLAGQVDAVLVIDDTGGGASHGRLARPFIDAGLPTFIDKPMTTDYAEAVALFDIAARIGAPLMSCSALRFAAEVEVARAQLAAIGPLSSVVVTGPGDWFYYGVHAVELLGTIVGTGASSLVRHAFPQRDVVVIDYGPGPTAVVQTLRDAAYCFQVVAYGEKGHRVIDVSDHHAFYRNTMAAVLEMAGTGVAPVRPDQTLEVLAILHAGLRAGEAHGPVPVTT